jgi:hypothetical protein
MTNSGYTLKWTLPAPVGQIILGLQIFLGLFLYARLGRPIWTDEFLHFAFGAFSNTNEAWQAIAKSISFINFSQTGVYMLVDFWLLKIFGASAFALRLPSLLSSGFMLLSAIIFFENKSFSLLWKIMLVLGFLAHNELMKFSSEARPYMPLAAAAVGLLAYYSTPCESRRRWVSLLGLASVLLGALFHPFFPVYWVGILIFLYGVSVVEKKTSLSVRGVAQFSNPWLVALGIIVYAVVAELSWLPRRADLGFDPFEFVHKEDFIKVFAWAHFDFIIPIYKGYGFDSRIIPPLLMLAVAAVYPFLPTRWRDRIQPILPPVALLVLALGLSLLLSYLSYLSHYWILYRQWIASMALVVIAIVWFFAEVARQISLHSRLFGLAVVAVLLCVFSVTIIRIIPSRSSELLPLARRDVGNLNGQEGPTPSGYVAWVALANQNIAAGGPVWTVFRRFYEQN